MKQLQGHTIIELLVVMLLVSVVALISFQFLVITSKNFQANVGMSNDEIAITELVFRSKYDAFFALNATYNDNVYQLHTEEGLVRYKLNKHWIDRISPVDSSRYSGFNCSWHEIHIDSLFRSFELSIDSPITLTTRLSSFPTSAQLFSQN